jgi:hypothetical protein
MKLTGGLFNTLNITKNLDYFALHINIQTMNKVQKYLNKYVKELEIGESVKPGR